MSIGDRLQYHRRILRAYLLPGKSQLTFWHDTPAFNPNAAFGTAGEYFMDFTEKARYTGHYDASGIPMLDYRGQIGLQYNPIAIAQWGLGNHSLFLRGKVPGRQKKSIAAARWLCSNLQPNAHGIFVWNHYFDWEYRTRLKAPWYSGLAQGQGVSMLLRAHRETGEARFLDAADRAFAAFLKPMNEGGVTFTDDRGNLWFEEYIVSPPTHILNGFIWAIWGVYDYFISTGDPTAGQIFEAAVQTLRANLSRYDFGFWSLYEQSGTRMPMVASRFYHRLHIVQLRVMYRITGDDLFAQYADRWERYMLSRAKRTRALCYKSAFKLCYY
jgi:heparosan-N-sulfate-glucuronate 5-epimerase